ncbi:GNAT family N-acetyltransferase [Planococcus sp. N064]|uniref:GNAT family N-acetyltransferase n=1 Tax=Planococcus liqunii TaxID=3058394 RepID=A0ABT8MWU6_9BACL|nr:GNAT family N-acetyltransferase [Planococcus sp. N064]MDN7229400.1 GNAT family N-acetyltransferase [Planococcus sp. N064]
MSWQYDPPYDFYNTETTNEEMAERLNGTYFALWADSGELVGFFCTGKNARVPAGVLLDVYKEVLTDMGLGMNPKLTGKGNGTAFTSFIINCIEENYEGVSIRLTVALFNKRAIHLYKKLGFVPDKQFLTDIAEFMTMVKR